MANGERRYLTANGNNTTISTLPIEQLRTSTVGVSFTPIYIQKLLPYPFYHFDFGRGGLLLLISAVHLRGLHLWKETLLGIFVRATP